MDSSASKHRVVIVGGGFAGVRAAQKLAERPNEFDITLISNQPHFEYHAALYRIVTGRSPLEVCIPLSTIFANSPVKVVEDTLATVYPKTKKLIGTSGSRYSYDSLILGLGSVTAFFNIPGLKDNSYGLKSITDALRLKRQLHDQFETAAIAAKNGEKKAINLIVVGGGPSGVELAGELAVYSRYLAAKHKLEPGSVMIDLFEASPRLLGMLPESASELATKRLRELGVNIFTDTPITERKIEAVYLGDLMIKAKTLIWTAGVTTNPFYATIKDLTFDKRGRVMVDQSMQAKGHSDLYVVGDAAASAYSGLAQTAVYDGAFVAEAIYRKIHGRAFGHYQPHPPISAIPIGPGWALVSTGKHLFSGRWGWIIRRLADLRFFRSILPLSLALTAFSDGYKLSENCPVCCKAEKTT